MRDDPDTVDRRLASAMIVDDHPLFCDALTMTLSRVAGIETVTTAGRLEDALDRLSEWNPDIVILDLDLPDVTGLDGLIRLRRARPDLPIIVVSSMADNHMVSAVLETGAAGFVPKHSQRDVFEAAFATIRRGGIYMPDGFIRVDGPAPSGQSVALSRLALLTNQQSRILQLICEGKLNKQIAFELSIAETTVKAHVTAIMRKLGVQSRTQAVLIAKEASFASILPTDTASA
ncbi:MAG: response regulator transcription factor [Pseudomonadota bacterium]